MNINSELIILPDTKHPFLEAQYLQPSTTTITKQQQEEV